MKALLSSLIAVGFMTGFAAIAQDHGAPAGEMKHEEAAPAKTAKGGTATTGKKAGAKH